MDFTRSIQGAAIAPRGLPWSWILGAHWLGLIVLPYFLVASLADAAADPEAWLQHRCWGQPHVVWLSLCNAGLGILALADWNLARRRATARWRHVGYGLIAASLVAAQVALWRWVEVLRWLGQ